MKGENEMPKEKTIIAIRIDKDVKEEFEAICKTLGMSTSDAINILFEK